GDWIDLPSLVGDRIGRLVGAAAGQVVVSDSTTVNLFKLALAALDAVSGGIVGDGEDFPTVRYVLQGLAERSGRPLRWLPADLHGTALLCVSGVNFRSGAAVDIPTVTAEAHRIGALVLLDLSHAAGCLPLDLDGAGVDLAVGCTYKYLNGGPGAPAWLYVRRELQGRLRQPIWGWWGQRDQFAMGDAYDPAPGMARFLTGTPPVLGIAAVDAGIAPLLSVGMPALWAKTRELVALLAARVEARLVPLGARIASPPEPERRGGHLAVAHPEAWRAVRALIDRGEVVGDFRPPDVMRLAPVAAYTRFVDVWDAVERIAAAVADPGRRARPAPRRRVT
ncbi:MAG: aminotransferase class V-fold PLP-dependent enzyme, partial [Acidimicrobiales bacterium]